MCSFRKLFFCIWLNNALRSQNSTHVVKDFQPHAKGMLLVILPMILWAFWNIPLIGNLILSSDQRWFVTRCEIRELKMSTIFVMERSTLVNLVEFIRSPVLARFRPPISQSTISYWRKHLRYLLLCLGTQGLMLILTKVLTNKKHIPLGVTHSLSWRKNGMIGVVYVKILNSDFLNRKGVFE